MYAYKRIVCLAMGLILIMIFSTLCELITNLELPFYQSLAKPNINHPTTYVFFLFTVNCLMAYVFGESIMDSNNREYMILWLSFFSTSFLSTISMYSLQNLFLLYMFSLMTAIICLVMVFIYIKKTKYRGIAMVPVAIWHIFLFLYNYYIIVMN